MKGDIAKQAQHVSEALEAPIVIVIAVDRTPGGEMVLETGVACVGSTLPPHVAAYVLRSVADRFRSLEQPKVTRSKAGGD